MDDTYRATVKSYNKEKGFGIITLHDGIAMLREDVLWGMGFLEDIEPGVQMQVVLKQTDGGRVVSEIRSFDLGTARIDKSARKVFFGHPTKPPSPETQCEPPASSPAPETPWHRLLRESTEAEKRGELDKAKRLAAEANEAWARYYRQAETQGCLATVKWYSYAKGVGVVTLDDGNKAILPGSVLKKSGYGDVYPDTRMYVTLGRELRDRMVSEILVFLPASNEEGLSDNELWSRECEQQERALREAGKSGEYEWACKGSGLS